jgi:2,5-diketo-D-gluconate reductase A
MPTIPQVTFNNGVEIPQVGFGVFLVPEDETEEAVLTALDVGYRHLDTAAIYGNEVGVGKAIAKSGIARDELFVTTKCWNADQGYDSALEAFDASMARLDLDYLDLYLVHWPCPAKNLYVDTWRAFEKLYADGRVRAIGVSNFLPSHLERLFDESDIVPAINQIELHPWLQQAELRAFDAEHGIVTEAWSPLAQGGEYLANPTIVEIAEKLDVSPAQVILRWHLDLGNVIIPKSVTASRIRSNLELFEFELGDDDHDAIAALDEGKRLGDDPTTLN